jgi:glycosyltransferase involved in cell wall biosynthesis
MRITVVTETYPPELNGVALTVARSIAYLRQRGHQVDVIRPCGAGETPGGGPGEWRARGFPLLVYPDLRFGLASRAALATRLAATRAQLVHVATEGPLGWAAIRAATTLGLPTTSDFRTNFHQYSRYYRLGWTAPLISAYLRHFHNRTDLSLAPSSQTRRELIRAGFERVQVVGRGVDLLRFSPQRRDPALRTRLSPQGGPILLYVGRLAAEKNVELALLSCRVARQFSEHARMVVVGDGPLRKRLQAEFPEAHFTGNLHGETLAAHYASADMFLFPSLTDTFGNVTLEALASGLPVVAFNLAAAGEHVRDRISGRLLPPGNAAAFMIATALMAVQASSLEPMRQAARTAAEAADWDSVLRRFEQRLLDTADAAERATATTVCAA